MVTELLEALRPVTLTGPLVLGAHIDPSWHWLLSKECRMGIIVGPGVPHV